MKDLKNNQLITLVITAIIVAVLAFFAGTQVNKERGQFPGGSGGPGGGQRMAGGQGMQPISGEITSNDGISLTIKMADGSSKIGIISSKTTINKTTQATTADLKVGEAVTVFGTTSSDGSMEINTISLGEKMGMNPRLGR